jgi:hypothetical protein
MRTSFHKILKSLPVGIVFSVDVIGPILSLPSQYHLNNQGNLGTSELTVKKEMKVLLNMFLEAKCSKNYPANQNH